MYAPRPPIPFCSLLNCPDTGAFVYNGRYVCGVHLEQLTRQQTPPPPPLPSESPRPPNDSCAFPTCNKPGICAHGRDYFCRRHLTPLLVLDAHVAGQTLPLRTRVNKSGRMVRICQVGHCTRNGNKTFEKLWVCKDHSVLLRQQDKFVDQCNAEDYAQHTTENATRTQVCNFVGCSNSNVLQKYHGVFCDQHLPLIDDIRAKIMMAKCHGDEAVQIPLRYNEIFLREFLDQGHVDYYNELVAKHGEISCKGCLVDHFEEFKTGIGKLMDMYCT
ncbi:hypothetical protein PHMEG_00019029 [Phytophthora megakarya]|uniref:Uncharacterized protein n=1 Tax=Phytophthora megakarya TaxID=4795 RepID=A0A225VTE2_9STRA|nr:hypothetical protein PHMEG_00019029 [Phytophthora megakarya]